MIALFAAVCALVSPEEIRAVQGEKPALERPSGTPPGAEQCFYQLPTFARSISLEVTRGAAARELWRRSFEEETGAEEREARPQRVNGLGKEAFYAGGARLGGLYVRTRAAVIRLSVGGSESQEAKIEKLRRLARAALRRL